jgi:2-oxoisovalerate dehydrogenase E1 component beta subunit
LGITRVRVPGELQRDHLSAPIERVTGWDTPYPHAQEWDYFPGPARVGKALKRVTEA